MARNKYAKCDTCGKHSEGFDWSHVQRKLRELGWVVTGDSIYPDTFCPDCVAKK